VISTVAGTSTAGYSGDGSPATGAMLSNPIGLALDSGGNLYIADSSNNVIRMIDNYGTIKTVAGNPTSTNHADGGPATGAALSGGPRRHRS